jgi:hypothetical protein
VSQILAFGTEGQCGDRHGLLGDLLAVKVGSNEKGAEPSATAATEQLDETELERMNNDGAIPKVSPCEVIKIIQALGPRDTHFSI